MPVLYILGILLITLIFGVVLFSGIAMVVSPRRWFDLPTYLTLRNGRFKRKELANRSGRFEIRYLGLAFAAAGAYMGASLLSMLCGSLWHCLSTPVGWVLVFAFFAPSICGAAMLLRPKWQIYKYRRYRDPDEIC